VAHRAALKTLAECIALQLQEREFCVIFDRDLECCWPSSRRGQNEREKSKALLNLKVGLPQFSKAASGQYLEAGTGDCLITGGSPIL
jgi:hypothetical protein